MMDAKVILQKQLARSLGLDRYVMLLRSDPSSPSFQRICNGYYRIRRNEAWRRCYYDLFREAKESALGFKQILTDLYRMTGSVEASFASKMLATLDPGKPIWDQYVLANLGLVLSGKTAEEKLLHAAELYTAIEKWYADYLATEEARANLQIFDRLLPDYAWISDVKKTDCLLWSKR